MVRITIWHNDENGDEVEVHSIYNAAFNPFRNGCTVNFNFQEFNFADQQKLELSGISVDEIDGFKREHNQKAEKYNSLGLVTLGNEYITINSNIIDIEYWIVG